MSGFESNIFINLPQSLEKHLICSICLNIYNNAVKTKCEHTFCKSCLQNWIENNNKNCPECRTGFTTRKRTTKIKIDNNLIIVCKCVFRVNLMANNIINELKVKCDYQSNGCQEVVELGLLSTHLLECEHRLCKTCEFTVGRDVEHNCLGLMKTDRNQLKGKLNEIIAKNSLLEEEIKSYKELNQKFNEMITKNRELEKKLNNKSNELKYKLENMGERVTLEYRANTKLRNIESKLKSSETKNTKLEKELNEIRAKNLEMISENESKNEMIKRIKGEVSNTLSAQSIYFGTYLTHFSKIILNSNGLFFDCSVFRFPLLITMESIEELKFCSDPSFPVIILRPNSKSCDQIRKRIQLTEPSKGWFDVLSKVLKERYIVIKFCPQKLNFNPSFGISLILHSFHRRLDFKYESIDVNEAKCMIF